MTTGCFSGVLWLFRPGFAAHRVDEWLPALDEVVEKLRAGASVADVGCGLGASTIILAEAFQRSTFVGLDIHEPSIVAAPTAAEEAGVDRRVRFDVATAQEHPGPAMTWCACSTACTTWVIRSGRPAASGRHWRQMARCCWSSR
jgi:tRNA/tmRNA/rRNA uracil-C5-methylase (TrmA/RlmC/RlmD family)